MLLTRNSDGKILDNGREILLRGGHCHLFSAVTGDRALNQGDAPVLVEFPASGPTSAGCAAARTTTGLSIPKWDNANFFLDRLRTAELNLTRVFLSNGAELVPTPGQPGRPTVTTKHPFSRTENGRWQVAAAIRDNDPDAWSEPYFSSLRAFVKAADQRGIAVQLCLFSYHDFTNDDGPTFKYWPISFWNAKNAETTESAWAKDNLVPVSVGINAQALNRYFFDTTKTGLMKSQKAYVERVLAAVCPSGNVILELMNEPRIGVANGQKEMATWLNLVTGWIRDWLTRHAINPRPLISANASYPEHGVLPKTPGAAPASDVDAWFTDRASLTAYSALDLISYHGLTGLADETSECGPAPQTDLPAIKARIARHKTLHPGKALMFSTDAVRTGVQTYPGAIPLHRRDGQVRTSVPYEAEPDPAQQRARFDLDNWAYHCFKEGLKTGDTGRVHFQNQSTYEASFGAIRCAYRAATLGPNQPCNIGFWQDPYVRVTGGANHQNFWWIHRHLVGSSEVVNQFHTENGAGSAATAAGESEIGWRYDLTAAGGPLKLSAAYDLRSVSETEDAQATVDQRLRLIVAPVVAGQPGTPVAQPVERPIQRGQQGTGRLDLTVNLTAGRVYAVIVTSQIAISYQNKARVGYGETIVRFPNLFVG